MEPVLTAEVPPTLAGIGVADDSHGLRRQVLGNQLARLEGQIAIGALVRRFPSMRLAVGRDQLQYKPVQALRGFRALPVTLR